MSNHNWLRRFEVETEEKWREIAKEIPPIDFSKLLKGATVTIVPPTGGAVARFWIHDLGRDERAISVYLDWYDKLGCYGSPYYEMYPHEEDTFRCSVDNPTKLINEINNELKRQRMS